MMNRYFYRKLYTTDPAENLYSVMKNVRLCGDFDVTNLRLRLLRSPTKMEIPHRRRYLRFGSFFCSQAQ
ncbi:hypothetical protein Y032_0907g2978 [Ancylostoma ceylanicum]|uniref:Uncharacterized protein n=1 Tax=Ancylostoma ceylanicum TaxID=53326 RepID=A0A016W909_9BILA|nr:hypothetical protein Y032_0907g2978 [Ancylostoma ceylanicum]